MKVPSKEMLEKYNVSVPRYTSYPTVPEWREKITQDDYAGIVKKINTDNSIALYVHIPFCQRLCWYCGCNTKIVKQQHHADKYLDYLFKEIDQIKALVDENVKVNQIHWGGGSPNFLTEEQTSKLMNKLKDTFDIDFKGEIAVEIDPRTTDLNQISHYRKLGFNRISMGIQSFDSQVQRAINRIQSYQKISQLIDHCRNLKFDSVNFDLIYGLPLQTKETFAKTLQLTSTLKPDRIALYSFAWLPQMRKHMSLIKEKDLPNTDEKAALFHQARKTLKAEYIDIAMDHFARPEDELSKAYMKQRLHRNFMGYTVQGSRDNIGLGMSSISYINHTFIQNPRNLDRYYELLDRDSFPVESGKKLNLDDRIRQWVIKELMCNQIVSKKIFSKKFNEYFDDYFHEEILKLERFVLDKLISVSRDFISVKEEGRPFLRNICSTFDSYYNVNKSPFSKAI